METSSDQPPSEHPASAGPASDHPVRQPAPDPGTGPHIWTTLGYQRLAWSRGSTTIGWDAPQDYCFPSAGGPVVQGGLVTALLDAAMGGACWSVLDAEQAFLTADLRVEFLRPTRPGMLTSTGTVVRRTRRVVFCAAELFDADGTLLATSRCTQVVLPAGGHAGRSVPTNANQADPTREPGEPPQDARG